MLDGRYYLGDEIGNGAYGVVCRARDVKDRKSVAVKTVDLDTIPPSKRSFAASTIETELAIMKSLDHPNVLHALATYQCDSRLHIVLELCEGPSLQQVLDARGALELDEVRSVLAQSLWALRHLHGRGIIHRDVKPANVMFVAPLTESTKHAVRRAALHTTSLSGQLVKLIDFGLARLLPHSKEGRKDCSHGGRAASNPSRCSGDDAYGRSTESGTFEFEATHDKSSKPTPATRKDIESQENDLRLVKEGCAFSCTSSSPTVRGVRALGLRAFANSNSSSPIATDTRCDVSPRRASRLEGFEVGAVALRTNIVVPVPPASTSSLAPAASIAIPAIGCNNSPPAGRASRDNSSDDSTTSRGGLLDGSSRNGSSHGGNRLGARLGQLMMGARSPSAAGYNDDFDSFLRMEERCELSAHGSQAFAPPELIDAWTSAHAAAQSNSGCGEAVGTLSGLTPRGAWALDVYALGQMLRYMLTGEEPQADGSFANVVAEVADDVGGCCGCCRSPPMPRVARHVSELEEEVAELLGRMTAADAMERIDVQQAIDHPWVQAYA